MGGEKKVVGKGRVTVEAKHQDGHIFPVELAIQAATTDEGEIFIAFLRDISRRVAAEAELVMARDKALASEKMKTEFLSTMSPYYTTVGWLRVPEGDLGADSYR
jgi:hypothetical protein